MRTGLQWWNPGPHRCWCDETCQLVPLWTWDQCTLLDLSWQCETKSVKDWISRDISAKWGYWWGLEHLTSTLKSSYSLALIGLEAVHVVGASDAPCTQEFQQVDFHRRLNKYKIVFWHAEAKLEYERMLSKSQIRYPRKCWQKAHGGCCLHIPVHIGGFEPLSTGKLHHHLWLLNRIRFI